MLVEVHGGVGLGNGQCHAHLRPGRAAEGGVAADDHPSRAIPIRQFEAGLVAEPMALMAIL